jgi:hypothetical protein
MVHDWGSRDAAFQDRVRKPKLPIKAQEKMRIAGKLVDGEA